MPGPSPCQYASPTAVSTWSGPSEDTLQDDPIPKYSMGPAYIDVHTYDPYLLTPKTNPHACKYAWSVWNCYSYRCQLHPKITRPPPIHLRLLNLLQELAHLAQRLTDLQHGTMHPFLLHLHADQVLSQDDRWKAREGAA